MSLTGQGSKVALGIEPSWGTVTPPTVAYEVESEDVQLDIDRIENETIRAATFLLPTTAWRAGNSTVSGPWSMFLQDRGQGELWRLMLGAYRFTGGTPNQHEFWSGPLDKSATMDVGLGADDPTGMRKRFMGCVAGGWSTIFQPGANVGLGIDWIGSGDHAEDESTATTGAYPADQQLISQLDVTTMTVDGDDLLSQCLKEVRFAANNNLDASDFCIGSSTIADPRASTGFREITGQLTVRFTDFQLYNKFVANTEHALVIEATAPSGNLTTFTANVRFDGRTPSLSAGLGKIDQVLPFKCIGPATGDEDGFKVTLENDDATLA